VDKCAACDAVLYSTDSRKTSMCARMRHHERLAARPRLDALLDATGAEIGAEVLPVDTLKFRTRAATPRGFAEGRSRPPRATRWCDAGLDQVAWYARFEFDFHGGSMDRCRRRFVRGVRVAHRAEAAVRLRHRLGGARMQEGLLSLVQMAMTTAALPTSRSAGAVHIGADGSDDGRRLGELRD